MTGAIRTEPTFGMSPSEAAAYWYVRQDGRDLSAEEQADFAHWIGQSPTHARHFAQMAAVDDLTVGHETSPDLAILRQEVLAAAPARRRGWWKAGAAGLVAASAAAVLLLVQSPDPAPSSLAPAAAPASGAVAPVDFTTRKGEVRTVRLTDGSMITLNTDSRLQVLFTAGRRDVRLIRGQALFAAAHDARRPFVVEAADRSITAIGTLFEVRLDPGRMEVTLAEGKIAVAGRGPDQAERTVLSPGQELIAETGATPRIAMVDVGSKLRWRDGFVEFADAPLGEAVAEINRYGDRPVVIADEGLATQRISGVFRTGDPARFVAIVGELLPIEARPRPDRIELVATTPQP